MGRWRCQDEKRVRHSGMPHAIRRSQYFPQTPARRRIGARGALNTDVAESFADAQKNS